MHSNKRTAQLPFVHRFVASTSVVVVLLLSVCDTSFGQSSTIAERIENLSLKIEQSEKDASLFLVRSKLRLELSEQQLREVFSSELAFPIERGGVEANALALEDVSAAIDLDSGSADAYFLRARVRMSHPDIREYAKWYYVYKHYDYGPYQEYGESASPENARRTLDGLILSDLNAGLRLQPDSKMGEKRRWSVLQLLGRGDQVLGEINQALRNSENTQERRMELTRVRLSVFKLEAIGDPDQATQDEAAIKAYDGAVEHDRVKRNTEVFIARLTSKLSSDDMSANERAKLLKSRAELYRRLNLDENADDDEREARSLLEKETRDMISGQTEKLAADDLALGENIALLRARAANRRYIGDNENADKDHLEAEKLDAELANANFTPLIEKVSRQIAENTRNARLEYSLLKRRSTYYERTNQNELAEADRDLAKNIHDSGYQSNSKLIGGTGN